jgi:hypothetical protein
VAVLKYDNNEPWDTAAWTWDGSPLGANKPWGLTPRPARYLSRVGRREVVPGSLAGRDVRI